MKTTAKGRPKKDLSAEDAVVALRVVKIQLPSLYQSGDDMMLKFNRSECLSIHRLKLQDARHENTSHRIMAWFQSFSLKLKLWSRIFYSFTITAKTALPKRCTVLPNTHGVPTKQYTGGRDWSSGTQYQIRSIEKVWPVSCSFLTQHRYRMVIRYLSKSKQGKFFALWAKNL